MDMEYDVKTEARKQYLNYFKVWFIILAILAVIAGVLTVTKVLFKGETEVRTNLAGPTERVYDNANVLSTAEEEKLRELIADAEEIIHADIVVYTINQPVEGQEAKDTYGYRYTDWEMNMRDIADDFYDEKLFGYDKEYSGVLLLDNWYKDSAGSQAGSWLSTCGDVYEKFGDYEINLVLDDVYDAIAYGGSAYDAYVDYVETVVSLMNPDVSDVTFGSFALVAAIVPLIVAGIFIAVKMSNKEGQVTTTINTYMNGNAKVNASRDTFIRKTVSTRRIPRSDSSGGSRSSGGRGGSHRSSSGRSHGGGGRRR